jgi:DNA polymerase-3 subunit beta
VKFVCERDVLRGLLDTTGRAVGKGPHWGLPVLACVLLRAADNGRLTASCTDLESTIEASAACNVEEAGVCAVPAGLLGDVVKEMRPGAVTVVYDRETAVVTVSSDRAEFQLRTAPVDDMPRMLWPDHGDTHEVDAQELAAALRRVLPAVSPDSSRPILCGVYLDVSDNKVRLVGTDSYRLAFNDLDDVELLSDTGVLVPGAALKEVARVVGGQSGMVRVRISDRMAVFSFGDVRVGTNLIEGDFPNYKGLVPKESMGRLTVNRSELAAVVKRVGLLSDDQSPIRFVLSESEVLVAADRVDVGAAVESVDGKYAGPDLTVGFNRAKLADGLSSAPGDTVRLDVIDGRQPAVIREDTDSGDAPFTYLLMPHRLANT